MTCLFLDTPAEALLYLFPSLSLEQPLYVINTRYDRVHIWNSAPPHSHLRIAVVPSLGRVQLFATPGLQQDSFSVLHYLPEFAQTCPLSQWCHPNISFSVAPFSSLNLSQYLGLFHWLSPLNLTKHGALEKRMAKCSSILALWTAWAKNVWYWKMSTPGQ